MEQPKLLDPVRNMIRTKHYSIRTEEAYVGWIKRFILFYGKRHPKELGKKEISAFLTHPAVNRNVSASTRNQRALRFGVLWRKRTLGSQSDKGLRWVEGILSIKETCRIKPKAPFCVLVNLVDAYFKEQKPNLAWMG